MKRIAFFLSLLSILALAVVAVTTVEAQKSDAELIADAESAGPATITESATIKTMDGRVLREGSTGWTCYAGNEATGPMCNQAQWDALLAAWMEKAPLEVKEFSVSYMLAGEGDAIGVSNTDPFATEPTDDNDWIKERTASHDRGAGCQSARGTIHRPEGSRVRDVEGNALRPHHG